VISDIIDISVTLSSDLVKWPDSLGFKSRTEQEIDDTVEANVSAIEMDLHCGTHIDAPLHFLKNGNTIETIPLNKLVGKCYVKDCGDAEVISENMINALPQQASKVLFKTRNSNLWKNVTHQFEDQFVALNVKGAQALAQRDIDLVGVDYLSIQGYYEHNDTHRVLLKNEVVLLETINLSEVEEGWYNLYCLPIKLTKLEAAPCRAILIKSDEK
jgi:arylformamidase